MTFSYESTYSKERHQWEVWKITRLNKVVIGIRCIFEGNKKQCQKKLKKLN